MKKLLIIVLSLCSLAWPETTTTKDAEGPALTIYNQNFFVAREYLPLDLTSGVNHVNFAGITSHLEPDSVILRDLTGRPLQILEQSYRNDPVSQELLLSMYEGKTIDFLVQRGDKNETIKQGHPWIRALSAYSQSRAAGMGQPIEIEGVLRFGLRACRSSGARRRFDPKPTLSWRLSTTQTSFCSRNLLRLGRHDQSDYNLVVSDGAKNSGMNSLGLVGWITMRNQSGKTFENARIKLVAGDVSKLQEQRLAGRMYAAEKAAVMNDAAAPVVREKSFDEFHLYTLERPATLRDNETKQVEFVRATGIQAQRLYVYDGAQTDQYGYYPEDQIATIELRYSVESESVGDAGIQNADTNHPGHCLPRVGCASIAATPTAAAVHPRKLHRPHAERRDDPASGKFV
jgi:hypothetical protein